MNKKTKNSITCLTVGLITGLFVLLVPWLNNINPDNLLHHLELKSIDFRINTLLKFKKLEKPPEVIVIEVDEETITTNAGLLKNKDISRKVYAELITILNSLGAKTIGFDMLFLKDADPNDPDNKLFIDTISKFDNVVLASKIKGLKNLECYTCQTSFYDYFPEDTYGVANISPDSDGIVRTFNYSYPIKRMNFKSLQEEIFYAPTLATALIQKYKPGLITDKQINEINPDNYYITSLFMIFTALKALRFLPKTCLKIKLFWLVNHTQPPEILSIHRSKGIQTIDSTWMTIRCRV
jgi:CHASE2 domain-containing sensor protein